MDGPTTRARLIDYPIAPAHVLDYAKAGVSESEFAYYERLRRGGRDVQQELRQRAVARPYPIAFRLDRVVGELPGLRSGLHAELEVSPRLDPYLVENAPEHPFPPEWGGPTVVSTWRERDQPVRQRGTGEWREGGSPEDYAFEPILDWSDVDELLVRSVIARGLDTHETCDVSWPPAAGLWIDGTAFDHEPAGCVEHEEFEPSCFECEAPDREPRVEMAEWRWYVDVTVSETNEHSEVREISSTRTHILTTKIDPRVVEYSAGGALR